MEGAVIRSLVRGTWCLTAYGVRRMVVASLVIGAATACRDTTVVAPPVGGPQFAKGGPSGTPSVTSTTPASAPRNTTLNVTVAGSGFDNGSRATWALNGDSTFATTKIRTNSTRFVSSSKLTANITIASDAPLDQFDVQVVTLGGRKGIGIELFTVTYEVVDLGAGDGSTAEAINDQGQIIGAGGTGVGAFLWEAGVLRQLGQPAGFTGFRAEDINSTGWVVGYGTNSGGMTQAIIWTPSGGPQALAGSLGGSYTLARAINDQGLIVGEAGLPGGVGAHTVVWENGVMRDIQAFPSGSTFPWGVSNTGIVVGQWNPTNGAYAWTAAGGMVVMTGLEGPNDIPLAVNDNGQIVGWYERTASEASKAFLWTNGVITDLGTLGGASSVAIAINNAGQIVGRADLPRKGTQSVYRAFLWTATGAMRDLGSLPDRQWAQANDVNNLGVVVGQTWLPSGLPRATLWRIR